MYHMLIKKNLRTVNLMKYNSHLINVEHRSNIPHQKWLLKYLQLPAVQNPFYIDKKHVKFNLSRVFLSYFFFLQCTEKLSKLEQSNWNKLDGELQGWFEMI